MPTLDDSSLICVLSKYDRSVAFARVGLPSVSEALLAGFIGSGLLERLDLKLRPYGAVCSG